MTSYLQLFLTVLPVLVLIALGVLLRRAEWIKAEAEESLFNLVIKVLTPCLIFDAVAGNAMLREPGNLLMAPLTGFGLTLLGIAVGYGVARGLGLGVGQGLRTFALTVGIANYGYLPLPIMESLFGPESRGLLLVHNVGVEAAIWTGGVLVVSGISLRDGWRKLLNLPLLALVLALIVNLSGLSSQVPLVLMKSIKLLAVCAIPMGLIMSGVSIQPHLNDPGKLFEPRISLGACLVRLALLPVIFLAIAKFGPYTVEMQRVIVVQAAMPTAVISIIVARVYGGQPLTAVQIVLMTTTLAMFTIPAWIQVGLQVIAP
ncbi:MAG: AEC family transporter [Candidatus Didemnitutus sp.]|nr:AEC family transporter [Candidatus Didemnitutus sp.]